ncbi:MAG: LPS export ABC transporter periplasmic protein LptC [Candidatus Dadabacteria bacterium]|nr:MAG: LPS export ABC transporter periplasmic protein LptC [Candidatus Dadabacteria bacterium]
MYKKSIFFLGFLLLIVFFLSCAKEEKKGRSLTKIESKDRRPQAVIKDFYRSNFFGKTLQWEVTGKEALIFNGGKKIVIQNSVLTFYQKKEGERGKITVAAPKALVFLKGGVPEKIEAKGGVKLLYNQELAVETPSAVYLFKKKIVKGREKVTVHHKLAYIKGVGFRANLNTLTINLLSKVYSVIKTAK